jgi:hypothetical protein
MGSPHLEEELIGGDCRSRSPLPNPSKIYKKLQEGRERKQAQEVQQWRREKCSRTP